MATPHYIESSVFGISAALLTTVCRGPEAGHDHKDRTAASRPLMLRLRMAD